MTKLTLIHAATFTLCAIALPAQAQSIPEADIATCGAIENNVQRLSCFDAITATLDTDMEAPDEDQISEPVAVTTWVFTENEDPIDGTNTSRAFVDADRQLNGRDSPDFLMIRCDGTGGFDLFIGTQGYIGGRRDGVAMEYRWGDNTPISERWSDSTNGTAAFLPSSYRDFLSGLRAGGELVVRWQDYRGNSYASRWDNVQLDDNADFILNGCRT